MYHYTALHCTFEVHGEMKEPDNVMEVQYTQVLPKYN